MRDAMMISVTLPKKENKASPRDKDVEMNLRGLKNTEATRKLSMIRVYLIGTSGTWNAGAECGEAGRRMPRLAELCRCRGSITDVAFSSSLYNSYCSESSNRKFRVYVFIASWLR
jgi:hypothetical protein